MEADSHNGRFLRGHTGRGQGDPRPRWAWDGEARFQPDLFRIGSCPA